ncbi:MAG: 16S rRNA (uracil(1498)-N(3))-methyltransferase [bacterium]|nr:16S rRNA (uracil(1498)-N(3))-methyltransferase [bacterium]
MEHLHRFYIPSGTSVPSSLALPTDEAHHALRVIRVRVGDAVELFDGRGREWTAEIAEVSRRDVHVTVTEERKVAKPTPGLTLVQAYLNREKPVEELIRRCTELGVDRFAFFRSRHSDRTPDVSERWTRAAVEAAKQCGRAWLPEFNAFPDLATALGSVSGQVLVATMDRDPVPLREKLGDGDIAVVVGPEGDLSLEELALLDQHGAVAVSLGATTFRSQVAAPLIAALVMYERGRLGPTA